MLTARERTNAVRIVLVTVIIVAALASDASAQATEVCLRPETPPAILPTDEQDMKDLIQEDYQRYFNDIAAYLNCLDREQASAEAESHLIIRQWQREFEE